MRLVVERAPGPLSGVVAIPPSKYHAHRALILAALAEGRSTIVGRTDARHVRFTLGALRALGVRIEARGDQWIVHGGAFEPRDGEVPVGSSGTTEYFLLGLGSLAPVPVRFSGQKYLQRRPIGPLLDALRALGVRLDATDERLPVTVHPGRARGGHVRIAGTLSQWISGLLILASTARERTVIEIEGELNERPYIELTIASMREFGLEVEVGPGWRRFEVEPRQRALPAHVTLPPDIGSAVFGLAACALHPARARFLSPTPLEGHPERAVLDVLREAGVPLKLLPDGRAIAIEHDGEPPRGTEIDCRDIPDMVPILSVLGALGRGRTTLCNVDHVRLKESDRVISMMQLSEMGARMSWDGSRLAIDGVARLRGAELSSYNDHRVEMALAVAGSRADGATTLSYPHAYRISYPEFLDDMRALGIPLTVQAARPGPRALTEVAAA